MLVSLLLGTVIAVGSLVAMRGRLATETLTAQPLNVSTVLVACLDPLAILLEIVTIVLIVWDSGQVGNPHRRLAWTAAVLFILWGLANFGLFLPLSFLGMRRGSLPLFKAGQMIKAGAALFQYSIPFLLAIGLSDRLPRTLLWLALILTVVGNFGVVTLPIAGMRLTAVESLGQTMYAPQFSVDYTTGWYPVLLALGYAGGALYLLAYAALAWGTWNLVRAGRTLT
jgi:hypothetical protein